MIASEQILTEMNRLVIGNLNPSLLMTRVELSPILQFRGESCLRVIPYPYRLAECYPLSLQLRREVSLNPKVCFYSLEDSAPLSEEHLKH